MTFQVNSDGYTSETATAPPIPVPMPGDPDDVGTGADDSPVRDRGWNVQVVSTGSMAKPEEPES